MIYYVYGVVGTAVETCKTMPKRGRDIKVNTVSWSVSFLATKIVAGLAAVS